MRDVGNSLSWEALDSYLSNMSPDSALARELNPKMSSWATRAKTNSILASVYDMLAVINSNLCAKGTGKRPHKPTPYPRPWIEDKKQEPEVTHIGKDALPPDELRAWFKLKEVE